MWLLCYLLELSFFIRCFAFRSKICFQFPCLFIFHWINLLNISKTSRKHLKRDVFFVTSLRRLVDTSQKRCFFLDVPNTSQKRRFLRDIFRRLKHISKKMFIRWLLWYFSKIYLESIWDYSKISHKNYFVLKK